MPKIPRGRAMGSRFWSRLIQLLIRQPARAASTFAGGRITMDRTRSVRSVKSLPSSLSKDREQGYPWTCVCHAGSYLAMRNPEPARR